MTDNVVRLVVTPETAGKFTARLESTGELLARGFDPATPLTIRHAGKTFDSFHPAPIGKWAKVSYGEKDKRGLERRPWMPFAAPRVGQKSGSERSGGTTLPAEDKSLVRSHPGGLAAWVPTGEPS